MAGQGAWSMELDPTDSNPFHMVIFNLAVNISYIETQGSPDQDCWPTSFALYYM